MNMSWMAPAKWDQWRLVVGEGRMSDLSFSGVGKVGIVMVRFVWWMDVVLSQLRDKIIFGKGDMGKDGFG